MKNFINHPEKSEKLPVKFVFRRFLALVMTFALLTVNAGMLPVFAAGETCVHDCADGGCAFDAGAECQLDPDETENDDGEDTPPYMHEHDDACGFREPVPCDHECGAECEPAGEEGGEGGEGEEDEEDEEDEEEEEEPITRSFIGIMPTASAGDLVTAITAWSGTNTSGAISALEAGNVVTVTGTYSGALNTPLTLDIDPGVTVSWEADLTVTSTTATGDVQGQSDTIFTILISGSGTFDLPSAGKLSRTAVGGCIKITSGSSPTINIKGTISAASTSLTVPLKAFYAPYDTNATINVEDGGSVTASGSNNTAIDTESSQSTVNINGGTVSVAQGSGFGAIRAGHVNISGGTITAPGSSGGMPTVDVQYSLTMTGGTVTSNFATVGNSKNAIVVRGSTNESIVPSVISGGTVTGNLKMEGVTDTTPIARAVILVIRGTGGATILSNTQTGATPPAGPTQPPAGAVVYWDMPATLPAVYAPGSDDNLSLGVDTNGVCQWAFEDGKSGIKVGRTGGSAWTRFISAETIFAASGITIPPVRSVTVDVADLTIIGTGGTLYHQTAGQVTFPLTNVVNIPGTSVVLNANTNTGISATGLVSTTGDTGTLTLTVTADAKTYTGLTVTIDGITSEPFNLTVTRPTLTGTVTIDVSTGDVNNLVYDGVNPVTLTANTTALTSNPAIGGGSVGELGTLSYQWYRYPGPSGGGASNATGVGAFPEYTLTAADLGHRLVVEVRASQTFGTVSSPNTSTGVVVGTEKTIQLDAATPPAAGAGWYFSSSIYYILDGADVTVTGSSATREIEVLAGATATVTLDNARIGSATGSGNFFPILIRDGANLTLKLMGESTLIGRGTAPGIRVPASTGTTLNIEGSGILNVSGGGAGIGGSDSSTTSASGIINIKGGTVNAFGGGGGAGIGTGTTGATVVAGPITISGDAVVFAIPGTGGNAGIGGIGNVSGTYGDVNINAADSKSPLVFTTSASTSGTKTAGALFTGTYSSGEYSTTAANFYSANAYTLTRNYAFPAALPDGTALTFAAAIPADRTLTIDEDVTLTIPAAATLTNAGTIVNNGAITGAGAVTNNGTINCSTGDIDVTTWNGTNKANLIDIDFPTASDVEGQLELSNSTFTPSSHDLGVFAWETLDWKPDTAGLKSDQNVVFTPNKDDIYAEIKQIVNVTYKKAEVDISGITGTEADYTGTSQAGYDASGVEFETTPGGDTVSIPSPVFTAQYDGRSSTTYDSATAPTNAGEYTVTLTLNDAWYTGVSDAIEFKITPKVLTIEGFSISKTYDGNDDVVGSFGTLEFDGLENGETAAVNASGVTAEYDDVNQGTNKSITFTNNFTMGAGTATAGNYTITQPSGITGTIDKRALANSMLGITGGPSFPYTGAAQTPSYTVTPGTGMTATVNTDYTVEWEDNITVGTAKLIIKATNGGNYSGTAEATFEIGKATAPTITPPDTIEIVRTQNSSGNEVDLSELNWPPDKGTTAYDTPNVTGAANVTNAVVDQDGKLTFNTTAADAGNQTITVVVTMQNYANVTITVTVSFVDKTPVTISGLSADSGAYTGSQRTGFTGAAEFALVAGGSAVTPDVPTLTASYSGRNGTSYGPNLPTAPTDAGDYTVTLSLDGDSLYTGSATVDFTISKVTLTPSIDLNGYTGRVYNGLTTITGGTLPKIALAGAVPTEAPEATATIAFVSAAAGTNKALNATGIELTSPWGTNYELSATTLNNQASTLEIEKASLTINTGEIAPKTYNGSTSATVTVVMFTGTVLSETLGLTDYTVSGAAFDDANAGSGKTVTATVALANTATANNYTLANPAANNLTIGNQTINKAPTGFSATTPANIHIITSNITENTYNLATHLNPTGTAATGTITYERGTFNNQFTGTNNILTGTPSLDSDGVTLRYTGTGQTTGTATLVIIISSENYADIERTLTFEATELEDQEIAFNTPGPTITRTYGDANFTNTASGGDGTGDITYTVTSGTAAEVDEDTGEVTIKGFGTVIITATKAACLTHAKAEATYTLNVEKATITITAEDKTATVGAALPTFTYTVEGLVEPDELEEEPTFTTDPTANMSVARTYDIIPSDAVVPNTVNYNEIIEYVNGTLTVSSPPSPPGGTPSTTPSGEYPITTTPAPTTGSEPAPSDVPSSWAKEAVEEAQKLNLVPVYLDGSWRIDLNRADFAALAVRLYELLDGKAITARGSFSDTTDTNVLKLAGLGIVQGDDGKYDPSGVFTREMAITLMYNMLVQLGYIFEDAEPSFADAESISPWARKAIGSLQRAKVIQGDGARFNPKQIFTREMGVLTIINFLGYLK